MDSTQIQALTFDIFGTVTDWRSTIIHAGASWGAQHGIAIDWARFADEWRGGYEPAMHRVRTGQLPWLNIDRIHRLILDELLVKYGITGLSEREKDHWNRVWHRLELWPDVKRGLERLRQRFVVATLSNGNVALLTNLAKHADLRWDCILSAELTRHYKPDPEVYRTAAELLGLAPQQVMMVAAHNHDLKGAQAVGFHTAFVHRPTEYGPAQTTDLRPDPAFDVVARDFHDLAEQIAG